MTPLSRLGIIFILAMIMGVWIASAIPDTPTTIKLYHYENTSNGTTLMVDEYGHRTLNVGGAYINTTAGWKMWDLGGLYLRNTTSAYHITTSPQEDIDTSLMINQDKYKLEMWVKPVTNPGITTTGHMIASNNNGTDGWYFYHSYASPNYHLKVYYQYQTIAYDGVVTAANLSPWLPINTWTHLALVQDSPQISIYLNGTRVASQPARSNTFYPSPPPNAYFAIGTLAGSYFWNGAIDEVKAAIHEIDCDPTQLTCPVPSAAYSFPYWSYTTAGSYQWVAPAGVTKIMAKMIGGGSGGQGAWTTYYTTPGAAGTFVNITQYAVTPGQSYTITVGDGGLGSATAGGGTCAQIKPGDGTASAAFGRTAPGGIGNASSGAYCTAVSTDGAKGLYGGYFGTSGTNTGSGCGMGHGAGGGTGGVTAGVGTGGNGADGAVIIMPYGFDKNYNYPNFTASPLTTTPGNIVNFTDKSVFYNTSNVVYDWDFGDGTPITHTAGNTSHVYAYAGSFSVNLTLHGGAGDMYELKENYVTVTNSQATTYMVPHTVTLNLFDNNNDPMEGVTITATPQNFTAPDGWLQQYYGVAPGVALNGTTLIGVTGYDGGWSAPMLGAYRYNFTFYKSGVVNNQSISMFPVKDEYNFKIPTVGQIFQPTPASNYITYYLYNNTVNSTAENFTIKYKDTSGGTGTIIYNITNSSGRYVLNGTIAVGGGTGWNNVTTANVSHGAGESLTVRFSAPQAQVGYVNKSYTVTWDNLRTLGGYPEWVGDWVGIAALVLFAGAISLANVKYAVVILPVLAGFMVVYTRWLSPQIGVTTFIASCGILFTLGILRYIRDQKGKLGRT